MYRRQSEGGKLEIRATARKDGSPTGPAMGQAKQKMQQIPGSSFWTERLNDAVEAFARPLSRFSVSLSTLAVRVAVPNPDHRDCGSAGGMRSPNMLGLDILPLTKALINLAAAGPAQPDSLLTSRHWNKGFKKRMPRISSFWISQGAAAIILQSGLRFQFQCGFRKFGRP